MTTPESEPHEAALFTSIRNWGIVRGDNGVVGGVIEGLGQRVGLARVPARLIVVVAAFVLWPLVALGYAAGWALLPDSRGNIIIQNFGRGITNIGALLGIAVLTLAGFGSLGDLNPFGSSGFAHNFPVNSPGEIGAATPLRVIGFSLALLVPLLILGGLVWLVVTLVRRSQAGGAGPAAAAGNGSPGGAGSHAQTTTSAAAPIAAPSLSAPPRPPAPPAPPRPPVKPRMPGPGRGFYLATAAWALLAGAGVTLADREDKLAIYPALAWWIAFLTGLGIIMILVSLSGRRLRLLGFLGIVSLLPALIVLGQHESITEAYNDDRSGDYYESASEPDQGVHDEQQGPVDIATVFAGDYRETTFSRACFDARDFKADAWGGTAYINATSLDSDASFDVTAGTTTVDINRGETLLVISDGDASATVYFPGRGLVCDFPGNDFSDGPDQYVRLFNPDRPSVTLTVHDDAYANTIIIQEKP